MVKLAAVVATVGVLAGAHFFHATLKSSLPAANSTVASPKTISLTFSEAILPPPASSFTLLKADSTSAMALTVTLAADKVTLSAPVTKALAPGKYIIRWKDGAADDGHALRGVFAFTVK